MKSTEANNEASKLDLTIRPIEATEQCAEVSEDQERDLGAKVVVVTCC